MKKKLVFMVISMNVGGTEKALLNMIAEMPKDRYEITILMLEKKGSFLNAIPQDVHVEYVSGYQNIKDQLQQPTHKLALKFLRKGEIRKSLDIILPNIIARITKDKSHVFKHLLREKPVFENEYDIAVAYAGPMDFISYFVVSKIKAKKKVQWIHFDVTKIGFDKQFASKIYNKFDKVFVVSDEGKNKLISMFPHLRGKSETLSNILSQTFVAKLANEGSGFEDGFKGVRILTVGRLSKEKGQDLTIPVLAKLKADGYNVRWYCIGDGNARLEYEQLIEKFGLQEDFILLGSNPNPYPFMQQCDIYVQSSRHEGFCITLAEARCFDNPIISTDFTGAKEQLSHKKTGLIVEFDEQQMYYAIKQILDDQELRSKVKRNLQREIVDTTKEIKKFYRVVETVN